VAVVQTFESKINFHPHVHAIVSRGGWTKTGQWIPVPSVDAKAAELLLRHKVLSLLRKAGVIDEERIVLLLSWKHSGFWSPQRGERRTRGSRRRRVART
jgi:hypothetical protein